MRQNGTVTLTFIGCGRHQIDPNVAKVGGLQSQASEGEVVVLYFEPSATQNLKSSGYHPGSFAIS